MIMSSSAPDLELEKVSINTLAPELLVYILTCSLDARSILRCATVCKRFYNAISSSLEIQHYIAIHLSHFKVVPYQSPPSSSSKPYASSFLASSPFAPHEVLAKQQNAWRTLRWTHRLSVPRHLDGVDVTGGVLTDGVLVLLNNRTRRVIRIPKGVRSAYTREVAHQPNDAPLSPTAPEEFPISHRGTRGHKKEEARHLKKLTRTFAFGYDVHGYWADAGQDLFVTAESVIVQSNITTKFTVKLRFHTLSSGAVHPLAYKPSVSLEKINSPDVIGGIKVFGDLIAILRISSNQYKASLYVWNWKDSCPGHLSRREKVIFGPISDFIFLSPTALLLSVAGGRGTVPRLIVIDLHSIAPENNRIDVFRDPARSFALPISLQYSSRVQVHLNTSPTDLPVPPFSQNDPLLQDDKGLVDGYFFKTDPDDKLISITLEVDMEHPGPYNVVILVPRSELWAYPANPISDTTEDIWTTVPPKSPFSSSSTRLPQNVATATPSPPTYAESSATSNSQKTFYEWRDWAIKTAVFVPQDPSMYPSLHGMKAFIPHDRGAVCCMYDFWKPRVRRAKWIEEVMEQERRDWVLSSSTNPEGLTRHDHESGDGEKNNNGKMRIMLDYLTGLKKNLEPIVPRSNDILRQNSTSQPHSPSQSRSAATPPIPQIDTSPSLASPIPSLHDTVQTPEEQIPGTGGTEAAIQQIEDFPNFFFDEQGDIVMLDPAETSLLVQLELHNQFWGTNSQSPQPSSPPPPLPSTNPSSSSHPAQIPSRSEPLRQDSGSSILSSMSSSAHNPRSEGTTNQQEEEDEDEDYAEEFGFFPPLLEDTQPWDGLGVGTGPSSDDDYKASLEWAERTFGVRRLPCVSTMFCSPELVGAEDVWLDEDCIKVLKSDEVLILVF
ncbi:hypothetical protein BDN72DRAFT_958957 [Pluteus cervinus]|uniref:Uncharacterized protein n=1 Tax=Pluteus cervinus TaxID=181527 RepID=A0ACD3AWR2_9AGAR|nr:hypothetical protein BDN72DRAFT_958957 [Pluteus cervinus]